MLIKPFETERLLIRPLESSDAEDLFLLDQNPEVMKYIGISPLTEVAQSEKVIQMIINQYEKFGIGRYAVIERESGTFIGWSGLKLNDEKVFEHQNFYELGYRFLPDYWGKGYAQETANAFIQKGFDALNLPEIFAYAHSENKASINTLQKVGFTKTGEFMEPDGLCYWYEIKNNKNN